MNYYRQPPKDRIMFTDDMFRPGMQQAFSVRTGNFLGYRDYYWTDEPDDPPPDTIPEPVNESQLTLNL